MKQWLVSGEQIDPEKPSSPPQCATLGLYDSLVSFPSCFFPFLPFRSTKYKQQAGAFCVPELGLSFPQHTRRPSSVCFPRRRLVKGWLSCPGDSAP